MVETSISINRSITQDTLEKSETFSNAMEDGLMLLIRLKETEPLLFKKH